MTKKVITTIYTIAYVAIIVLLVASFIDIFTNNLCENPTYQSWNVIAKFVEYVVNK